VTAQPPEEMIESARNAAMRSECVKSKRGVVIYDPLANNRLIGRGWNGQPKPFRCMQNDVCRTHCNKLCVHAEARAIAAAREKIGELHGFHLLHVKIYNGIGDAIPGGRPSCWQCSREILDAELGGVWLWELGAVGSPIWRFYIASEFHEVTLRNNDIAGLRRRDESEIAREG
jgi:deoxycytidylate deaminase